MNTFRRSGVNFNIINELPQEVEDKFLTTLNEFLQSGNDFDRIDNILNYIAGGACGRVYDLGNGFILKINRFTWSSNTPDGDILRDLQGVPMIPKLYWYSEDNRFIIIQKIDGVTTGTYTGQFTFQKDWEEQMFKQLAQEVDELVKERGWVLNDIHSENCMIDREGNLWIVDVGLFKRTDDIVFGDGLYDLLTEVNRITQRYEMAKQRIA